MVVVAGKQWRQGRKGREKRWSSANTRERGWGKRDFSQRGRRRREFFKRRIKFQM
ncbi:hypothetical protein KSP39_PZI012647 [Platanthera zijinensis]|uniref:Uncharacterized protein n=1 Tax=Platanthera zijinensis TaxID=2320716 RepID=A0AAP0G4J6_9ASPA